MNLHTSKIGLRNFRVLKNETNFELAPITLLVGPNNSGKSSVINAMKILQENLTRDGRSKVDLNEFLKTRFDTGSLRDRYGNFNQFVNNKSSDDIIEISFSLKLFELLQEVVIKIKIQSLKNDTGEIKGIEIYDDSGNILLLIDHSTNSNQPFSQINFNELKKHFIKASDLFGKWYNRITDLDINLVVQLEEKVEEVVNDIATLYKEIISIDEIALIVKDLTARVFKDTSVIEDDLQKMNTDIVDFFSGEWVYSVEARKRNLISGLFDYDIYDSDSYFISAVINFYFSANRPWLDLSRLQAINKLVLELLLQNELIGKEKAIIARIKTKHAELIPRLEEFYFAEQNRLSNELILPEVKAFITDMKFIAEDEKFLDQTILELIEKFGTSSLLAPEFYVTNCKTKITNIELLIRKLRIDLAKENQTIFNFDILFNNPDADFKNELLRFLSEYLGKEITLNSLRQNDIKIELDEFIFKCLTKLTYNIGSSIPNFEDFGYKISSQMWERQSYNEDFLNRKYFSIKKFVEESLSYSNDHTFFSIHGFPFDYLKYFRPVFHPDTSDEDISFLIGLNTFYFLAKHNITYFSYEDLGDSYSQESFEKFKNRFRLKPSETEVSVQSNNYFLEFIQNGLMEFHNHLRNKFENELHILPAIKTNLKRNLSVYENGRDPFIKLVSKDTNVTNHENRTRNYKIWKELGISEGYKPSLDTESGIVKLWLTNKDQDDRLFIDEGHGVSQLTVLCYLISLLDSPNQNHSNTIFVEEPELSLHPSLQSKLANLFMIAAKEMGIQSIIETHSEYLVRKLQYLTAKGELKPGDVVIYYFNSEDEFKRTGEKTYRITIEKDGRLSRPFGKGFYDEASGLMIDLMNLNVN